MNFRRKYAVSASWIKAVRVLRWRLHSRSSILESSGFKRTEFDMRASVTQMACCITTVSKEKMPCDSACPVFTMDAGEAIRASQTSHCFEESEK